MQCKEKFKVSLSKINTHSLNGFRLEFLLTILNHQVSRIKDTVTKQTANQRCRIYPCAQARVWGKIWISKDVSGKWLGEKSRRLGKFFEITADSAPLRRTKFGQKDTLLYSFITQYWERHSEFISWLQIFLKMVWNSFF